MTITFTIIAAGPSKQAAVDALHDAGFTVDRVLTDDEVSHAVDAAAAEEEQPTGWMKWVSIGCALGVVAALLAWVWVGDWRWGATAGVAALAAFVFLGLSISQGTKRTF